MINFNNWRVYYMDNDGRKQIISLNLSYLQAVKMCQTNANKGFSTNYESNK
jgi:hypothetical protein